MDTNSDFSCKVTLSANNVAFLMHRSTLSMNTNSQFSCRETPSVDYITQFTRF